MGGISVTLEGDNIQLSFQKGSQTTAVVMDPGAADRSYGLQVARLAGLPPGVIERAKTILGELERADRERPKRALVDDLPLFAASARPSAAAAQPERDALREALDGIDPDELTPKQALEALYRLKTERSAERR